MKSGFLRNKISLKKYFFVSFLCSYSLFEKKLSRYTVCIHTLLKCTAWFRILHALLILCCIRILNVPKFNPLLRASLKLFGSVRSACSLIVNNARICMSVLCNGCGGFLTGGGKPRLILSASTKSLSSRTKRPKLSSYIILLRIVIPPIHDLVCLLSPLRTPLLSGVVVSLKRCVFFRWRNWLAQGIFVVQEALLPWYTLQRHRWRVIKHKQKRQVFFIIFFFYVFCDLKGLV
jgi:hypothetical protein